MNKISLRDCPKRKLEETYLVIYAIKNEINIKKNDFIENNDIYTFIGINTKGYRELINIYPDKPLNNRYWLDCFENLKSRGLKNILFLSVDDNKNIKRTAKIAFPEITFIDSMTYIVPKFYKYSMDKEAKKVASRLNKLYTKKTLEEYKQELKTLKEVYNNAIHEKLIEKYLSNVESCYKYSNNIRKLLFKHSANLQYYDKIRLYFNNHNSYINDIQEIYEKLDNEDIIFSFTSFNRKEWTFILNDFIKLYPKIEFI